MSRLLAQRRAKHALDRVTAAAADQAHAAEYERWCKRLPAMVLGNGLGQALAFLRADAGGDRQAASLRLYRDVSDWLVDERRLYAPPPGQDLLAALCAGDRWQYLRAQRETVEWLSWATRFATAYIGKEAKPSGSAGQTGGTGAASGSAEGGS